MDKWQRILDLGLWSSGLNAVLWKVKILLFLGHLQVLSLFPNTLTRGLCQLTWHVVLVSFAGLWLVLATRTSKRRSTKKQFSISIRAWQSIALPMFWRSVSRCAASLLAWIIHGHYIIYAPVWKYWHTYDIKSVSIKYLLLSPQVYCNDALVEWCARLLCKTISRKKA